MGFKDIRYGWEDAIFELTNVRIVKSINSENSEDKSKAPEFQVNGRRLAAKAISPERMYQDLYIGVPEDKKSLRGTDQTLLDDLHLNIYEETEEMVELIEDGEESFKYGRIGYRKPFEGEGGYAYCSLVVSKDTFDEIERMASEVQSTFEVKILYKGWNWLGPIGDSQMYIDVEGDYKAQLLKLEASKIFLNPVKEEQADVEGERKPTIADLHTRIMNMERLTISIKSAAWLTAFAAIAIAVVAVL